MVFRCRSVGAFSSLTAQRFAILARRSRTSAANTAPQRRWTQCSSLRLCRGFEYGDCRREFIHSPPLRSSAIPSIVGMPALADLASAPTARPYLGRCPCGARALSAARRGGQFQDKGASAPWQGLAVAGSRRFAALQAAKQAGLCLVSPCVSAQSFLHDVKLDGMIPTVEFDKPAIDGQDCDKFVLLNQSGDCGFNPFNGRVFAPENLNARLMRTVRALLGNGDYKNRGALKRGIHVSKRDRAANRICLLASCPEQASQVAPLCPRVHSPRIRGQRLEVHRARNDRRNQGHLFQEQ